MEPEGWQSAGGSDIVWPSIIGKMQRPPQCLYISDKLIFSNSGKDTKFEIRIYLLSCRVTKIGLSKRIVIYARHTTINMVLVVAPTVGTGTPKAEYAKSMPSME